MKLLIMQSLPPPIACSLLDPNILLSTLFSNTLNLWPSPSVRDQVPHPNGAIINLCHIVICAWRI